MNFVFLGQRSDVLPVSHMPVQQPPTMGVQPAHQRALPVCLPQVRLRDQGRGVVDRPLGQRAPVHPSGPRGRARGVHPKGQLAGQSQDLQVQKV